MTVGVAGQGDGILLTAQGDFLNAVLNARQ
jgi:hypothetical protein